MLFTHIRIRLHFGYITIRHDGYSSSKSISGNTVAVAMNHSFPERFPFGGFIEGSNVLGMQRVKILEVERLQQDEFGLENYIAIPRANYVVGVLISGSVYVLVHNGSVSHFPYFESSKEDSRTNNVFELAKHRQPKEI